MIQSTWRRVVKSGLRQFGYDFIRFHPESSDSAKIMCALRYLGTDLVLDVGANEGQHGRALRDHGYTGRLVSFEPLTSAHARLLGAASGDPQWTVHERCAIGDHDGEVKINIAGNNVSSSLLPMLDKHTAAAPESKYIGSETTPIFKLDTLAPRYVQTARSVFLKIDTQGFEAPVLRGASALLKTARAVQLEVSLVPLYEGQEMWDYFVAELGQRGFVIWTLLPGFVEEKTGRTLQMDAIFVRA